MKKPVPPLPPQKTAWYLLHPERFIIDKPEANVMLQANGQNAIVRIPEIKDRIRINDEGEVLLVTGQETDEETIELGRSISGYLPGRMISSDVYFDYFDSAGNLTHDPMKAQKTAAERQPENEEEPEKPAASAGEPSPGARERLRERVAEELKENNTISLGGITLVRIPDIPGIRTLPPNKQGQSLVEYKYDQWYDPIKKQSRNKKAIIGQLSDEYPDAMIPNERYRELFDIQTGRSHMYRTPEEEKRMQEVFAEIHRTAEEFRQKAEEEKRRKEEAERLKALYGENSQEAREAARTRLSTILSEAYDRDPDTCDDDEISEEDEPKENRKEEMKEDIQELYEQAGREKEQTEKERERAAILRLILASITKAISNQARKHPNDLINAYKAQTINSILIEIRVKYQNTGYADLLGMIREPEEVEENGQKYLTGMTYSDAEVLLTHYATVIEYIHPDDKK